MASIEKRLAVAIWENKLFRGSRSDARAIARAGVVALRDVLVESAEPFEKSDLQYNLDDLDQTRLFES